MRRLTYYEEYPIYEPAEGGYYYEGNRAIESKRMSKRKCREKFEEIWKRCQEENELLGFVEGADWNDICIAKHIYPWIRLTDNKICRRGFHIGEGQSYVIERHYGSEESGYVPYS